MIICIQTRNFKVNIYLTSKIANENISYKSLVWSRHIRLAQIDTSMVF